MPAPSKTTLITAAALILVLVFLGAYCYFSKPKTVDPFSNLSGKLYLTLSPIGENRTRLYKYDISTKLLEKIAPLGVFAMTASLSPDNKKTAFSMYPQTGTATTTLQIHLRNRTTGEIQQLTHSPTILKRMPDWSPDGMKIAFMAQPLGKKVASAVPDDWNV